MSFISAATEQYKIDPPLECNNSCIDDWRVEIINFAPNVFSTSSCLHVTLLVLLRYFAVSRPAKYALFHTKIRRKSIIVIWMISVITPVIAVVAQLSRTWNFYFYYRYVNLHLFHTIPILCIVLMYAKLILMVRKRSKQALETMSEDEGDKKVEIDKVNQKMTLMVQRVVLFLVVCYVPYLAWMQYYYMHFPERRPYVVKSFEVSL